VLVQKIKKLIFGDEIVILHMPATMLKENKRYFPIKMGHIEYQIQVDAERVIVITRSIWKNICGFPPIYRFEGKLAKFYQKENKIVSIAGIVTINPVEKIFLSTWFILLFIFFIINIVWAIYLILGIMFLSNTASFHNIETVGFMLGGGCFIFMFGVALLTAVRKFSRGERKKLIEFCTTAYTAKNTSYE
jgi:hypothetical protein